jgi:RNA polymerase sigma-70 factor (ECF subfamily)
MAGGLVSACGLLETSPEDNRSDEALIARISQGDAEAFEVLYRRHRDWVANLAFRFLGDRDLALDVLQETFLYVLRKFPGFRLTCQFRSFLYPAVRNLSIAARRKAGRLRSDDPGILEQIAAPPLSDAGDSSRAQLSIVLTSLPEAQREVLLLRFVEGLSLNEIAAALEVPTGTVKSRLHHALATLRQDERTRNFFLE